MNKQSEQGKENVEKENRRENEAVDGKKRLELLKVQIGGRAVAVEIGEREGGEVNPLKDRKMHLI